MQESCSVCSKPFTPTYVYQLASAAGRGTLPFCSLVCRQSGLGAQSFCSRRARRIAILNHKGGTGKTTTAVNVAAELAHRGASTLLVDTDAQGNVAVSLGIKSALSLYQVLVEGIDPKLAIVKVREGLDVLPSNETLAAAEIFLARSDTRDRSTILTRRLVGSSVSKNYDFVIIDCGPSLNLLNQNALSFADEVVIPVACNYMALVGVKQVLRTIREMEQHLGHAVRISGVLPTFFDSRTKLAIEALETLQQHFKNRCLEPIRTNVKLAEAPSKSQTIFDYAPNSIGAEDYRAVVTWLLQRAAHWQRIDPQSAAA